MAPFSGVVQRLKARFARPLSQEQAARKRIKRREALLSKFTKAIPYIQAILALAGYIQFLCLPLPLPQLGRRAFIDENAFQPGQVNVQWTWPDVTIADRYAERLQNMQASNSADRASYLENALLSLGLEPHHQSYQIKGTTDLSSYTGINTYTRIKAPRTSGAEVLFLCAPWTSREAGMKNVRGQATLLALARHLMKSSVWSKDIVLLFSDGNVDGVQAWLTRYHSRPVSGIDAEPLHGTAGSIWLAQVIDYPYHSFSHMGIYYDGVNGRLPNLDLVNGAAHITRWLGGVNVRFHNQTYNDPVEDGSITAFRDRYVQRAKGLLQQSHWGATTKPSGPEGLFGQYGIDAVALFAIPAGGPHGFFAIGRIVESLTRAQNNLVERLHASFFLYLLPEPFQFLEMAKYLSAPILIAVSLTIAGLRGWSTAPSGTGLPALLQLLGTHSVGLLALFLQARISLTSMAIAGLPLVYLALASFSQSRKSGHTLLALNCLATGMFIPVTTILNYSLGSLLSLAIGTPTLAVLYLPTRVSALFPILAAAITLRVLAASAEEVAVAKAPLPYFVSLIMIPAWLQLAVFTLISS